MDGQPLYAQISDLIRQQILHGEIQPGARLPSVRQMTTRWHCTPGTVQRAYQELARQGLITSRAGQGTRVIDTLPSLPETPLRRLTLIHSAEAFLLEAFGAGYTIFEAEEAVRLAFDRWRVVTQEPSSTDIHTLRFTGSHDPAVAWLATHFPEIVPGFRMQVSFTGSLGGLIALAEDKADLAGSHLWDETNDSYNVSFVKRVLPGKRIALLTLAHRRLGLIVPPGNPRGMNQLSDLCQPGIRFINRQPGSGTRVWLDAQLRRHGVTPSQIQGYENEMMTHSDVAQAVAEDRADVGLGLEAAARTCGLEFVMLTCERFDLVIPAEVLETPPIQKLMEWIQSPSAKETISSLGGYEVSSTGNLEWVE